MFYNYEEKLSPPVRGLLLLLGVIAFIVFLLSYMSFPAFKKFLLLGLII